MSNKLALQKIAKTINIVKIVYQCYKAFEMLKEITETEETTETEESTETEEITETEETTERRRWIRELNLCKDPNGFYATNINQMMERDPEHFYQITRMSPQTYQILRSLIEPRLEKSSWRKPIEPSARLFLVLLYLSQGVPRQVLAWMFQIGYSTVLNIIYETCDILWESLMPLYLSPPNETDWETIATGFEQLWNLPNCVGAIDGKHINIQCPPGGGSEYFNYKGRHSIVLLAACDASYTFTSVDIGAYGSQSGGGIFAESPFGRKIMSGDLSLPPPKLLPNSDIFCNHYLVGGALFPLKPYLMRPYPGRRLNAEKHHFNKRLSRAHRVIENAFGILVAKWRILGATLNMLPTNAEKIVKATTVLHNFVKLNEAAYCTPEFVDSYDEDGDIVNRGLWRNEITPLPQAELVGAHNSSRIAFTMRDQIKDFICKQNLTK